MGLWGRHNREAEEEQQQKDDALAQRARTALVTADERIRVTGDELGFATAELGEKATAELRVGLESVREHMNEAFHLNQLNHDHIPDTPEELRTRNARIIQLCEWAENVLNERTANLQERIALVRSAPETLQRVRADVARLRARLPEAKATLQRIEDRYSPEALQRVRLSTTDAEQLLDFALHSADLSERRRAAAKPEDANVALEAATETVRRAITVFEGVDNFEIEALRAQNTLADVIEDSRSDIAAARSRPGTPAVSEAIAELEEALQVTSSGERRDPFADLSLVSAANAALDTARERAAKPVPSLAHVQHDISTADHAISVAGNLIEGHRGWIGADARTRYAEAQRARSEVAALPTDEGSREEAQQLARRALGLAEDALRLAQRDIDSSRPDNDDWGWGGNRGRGDSGLGILGPVFTGVLLGGMIDNIFD